MTPTLKEQLEQWIEREAEKYQKEYASNLNLKLRIYSDIRDANKAGAHSILPMLLVAVECLKEVQTRTAHMQSKHAGKLNRLTTEELNKIKSMMEGKGNE